MPTVLDYQSSPGPYKTRLRRCELSRFQRLCSFLIDRRMSCKCNARFGLRLYQVLVCKCMSSCFTRLNTLGMVPSIAIECLVKFQTSQVTQKWEQILWSELFPGNIHLSGWVAVEVMGHGFVFLPTLHSQESYRLVPCLRSALQTSLASLRYQPLHILHQILTYFATEVIKLADIISAVCSDYLISLGQWYVFYYKLSRFCTVNAPTLK